MGIQEFIPLALLARAAYHRHTHNWQAAEEDLEEVLDIAEPSGMRLHLTDYHLEMARLRLAQERLQDARPHVAEAARLIEETGYHRRDKELEELSCKRRWADDGVYHQLCVKLMTSLTLRIFIPQRIPAVFFIISINIFPLNP